MKKILLSSILLLGIGVVSMAQEKRNAASAVKQDKAVEKTKAEIVSEKAQAEKTAANTSSLNQTQVYISKSEVMKAARAKKN